MALYQHCGCLLQKGGPSCPAAQCQGQRVLRRHAWHVGMQCGHHQRRTGALWRCSHGREEGRKHGHVKEGSLCLKSTRLRSHVPPTSTCHWRIMSRGCYKEMQGLLLSPCHLHLSSNDHISGPSPLRDHTDEHRQPYLCQHSWLNLQRLSILALLDHRNSILHPDWIAGGFA